MKGVDLPDYNDAYHRAAREHEYRRGQLASGTDVLVLIAIVIAVCLVVGSAMF